MGRRALRPGRRCGKLRLMGRGTHQGLGFAAAVAAILLVACQPPPPPVCPVGQVQDVDTEECVPEHCGSEPWGLIERTGDTIHVAPWGDDDWDGSERWPYRTIQQGADEAGDEGGGLVAVAAGTYVENLELDQDHNGVEIAGRCLELVVIDGSGAEAPGVQVTRGELRLRSVTVTGGQFGVRVEKTGFGGSAEVDLEEVALVRNLVVGLGVGGAGAAVEANGCEVLGTLPAEDGNLGRGVEVAYGARLVAWGLRLEGNHDVGLRAVQAGTTVDLVDATVRDTQPLPDGTNGPGIVVQDGASLVARGLLLEGNHGIGLGAKDTGTRVDLETTRITGTWPPVDGAAGFGILVQQAASVTALDLQVEDNGGPGLYLVESGELQAWNASLLRNGFAGAVVLSGHLALHGGTVSGSAPHPSEGGGAGVFGWDMWGFPDIEIEGVAFFDLPGPALYVRGPGRYRMRDCDVREAGTWPWLPGGVLAVEGVQPWYDDFGNTFIGLFLAGNTFSDLASDAILLDSSSATLVLHPSTGLPNTFADLDGEPLVWQRCEDVLAPEILDGSIPDPVCEPVPRGLGPLLEYRLWLAEVEPLE